MGLLLAGCVQPPAVRAEGQSVPAYHEGWVSDGLGGSKLDWCSERLSSMYLDLFLRQYLCVLSGKVSTAQELHRLCSGQGFPEPQ